MAVRYCREEMLVESQCSSLARQRSEALDELDSSRERALRRAARLVSRACCSLAQCRQSHATTSPRRGLNANLRKSASNLPVTLSCDVELLFALVSLAPLVLAPDALPPAPDSDSALPSLSGAPSEATSDLSSLVSCALDLRPLSAVSDKLPSVRSA